MIELYALPQPTLLSLRFFFPHTLTPNLGPSSTQPLRTKLCAVVRPLQDAQGRHQPPPARMCWCGGGGGPEWWW
jgi:hypothetical protein